MSSVPIGLLERRVDDVLRRRPLGNPQIAWRRQAGKKAKPPAPCQETIEERGGSRPAKEQAELV